MPSSRSGFEKKDLKLNMEMVQVNLLSPSRQMPRSDRETHHASPEEDMERTILKSITHGLVFVNSRRYRDAFERLILHLLQRTTQVPIKNQKVRLPTFPLIHRTFGTGKIQETQTSKGSKPDP